MRRRDHGTAVWDEGVLVEQVLDCWLKSARGGDGAGINTTTVAIERIGDELASCRLFSSEVNAQARL